jgi:hypothetical protein
LGYYNNSLFNDIYSSILVFKVVYTLYLRVFFLKKKVGIKRLILTPVIFKVMGISGLVYISLVTARERKGPK